MRQRREAGAGRLVALVAVLGLAVGLRVVALRWGLPDETHLFSYHPDEYHSLRGILSLAAGDLNPHFFNYGSLYLYLVAAACVLRHPGYVLADDLWVAGGPGLPAALRDWTLDARVVTVALGTLTVLVAYLLARRIWGHRAGLIAALTLAVMPLHVVHSHYATVDVPMTFFITLTLLLSVRALEEPSWRNFAWAGAAAGLAASVKYSGIVCLVAPATAWVVVLAGERQQTTPGNGNGGGRAEARPLHTAKANGTAAGGEGTPRHDTVANGGERRLRQRRTGWAGVVILVVAAVVAFAVTSPFTFLDRQHAWRDISFEMQHMRVGDDPAAIARDPCGRWFHVKQLNLSAGWLLLAVGLWATIAELKRRRWELLPLVVFSVLVFLVIGAGQVRYARYEMPLLPVLAVMVGWAGRPTKFVMDRLLEWGLVAFGLAWAVTLSWLWLDVMAMAGFEDPRRTAVWCVEGVVPEDGTLGLVSEPWFHHPPVDYCNGGAALRPNPIWRIYKRPVRKLLVTGLDPAALRETLPDAFLFTEFDLAAPREQLEPFMAELRRHYRVSSWTSDDGTGVYWPQMLSPAPAHDWLYPFPLIHWCPRRPETERPPGVAADE